MFKRYMIVLTVVVALFYAASNYFSDQQKKYWNQIVAQSEACSTRPSAEATYSCNEIQVDPLTDLMKEAVSEANFSLEAAETTIALMLLSAVARWVWKGKDK